MKSFLAIMLSLSLVIVGDAFGDYFNFRSTVTYPGVPKPHAVVAADFNNDGNVDLAMANRDMANVGLYLGNGDNTFQPAVYYPAGARARDIAVADYNSDGYLDMAVANEASDSMSVLMNAGDGTFVSAANYYCSHPDNAGGRCRPWHIETADYDQDGYPDLAVSVTNRSINSYSPDDSVYLFLNNGSGVFGLAATLPVVEDPRGLAAADYNLDGYPDLAVSCYNDTVEVFLNNGDTTFTTAFYRTGGKPVDICASDLDNDSDPDLAVINYSSETMTVLVNDGAGTFSTGASQIVGEPWAINTADMDNDGDDDILVAAVNVWIIRNDGVGTMSYMEKMITGGFPRALCGADFNNDGDVDLAVANAYSYLLATRENLAAQDTTTPDTMTVRYIESINRPLILDTGDVVISWTDTTFDDPEVCPLSDSYVFGSQTRYNVGQVPCDVYTADFDNDGYADIATVNTSGDNITILLNDQTGSFGAASQYQVLDGPKDMATADMDGDGYLDIVVANYGTDSISVLFNDSNGAFGAPVSYDASQQSDRDRRYRPHNVQTADLNNDGAPDVIVSVISFDYSICFFNQLYVFFNNGDGTLSHVRRCNFLPWPTRVATGDFDTDGNVEFVAVASGTVSDTRYFFNDGDTTFYYRSFNAGWEPADVKAVDLDGDNDLDMAITALDSRAVTTYINNGSGLFTRSSFIYLMLLPSDVNPVDIDTDGDLDLVVTGQYGGIGEGFLILIENHGDGSFGYACRLDIAGSTICSDAADFNHDGYYDLVTTDAGYPVVTVILSAGPQDQSTPVFDPYVAAGDGGSVAHDICTVDLNCDGHEEMAFAAYDLQGDSTCTASVATLTRNPDGSFSEHAVFGWAMAGVDTTLNICRGDLNADGVADLVASNRTVTVGALSKGSGSFGDLIEIASLGGAVALGDVDRDGLEDLIIGDSGVHVLLNIGGAAFAEAAAYTVDGAIEDIAVCDVNEDGWPDLIIASGGVEILLNQGDGTFGSGEFDSFLAGISDICFADFNGDGLTDLATTSETVLMSVYLALGDGEFSDSRDYVTGGTSVAICTADLNADGYPDLAVANNSTDEVSVFLNNGTGLFMPGGRYAAGHEPVAISALDVDSDGDFDLAVGCRGADSASGEAGAISILYNQAISPTDVPESDIVGSLPSTFALAQNYPNPFNPVTTVTYAIPDRTHVSIMVYNILGQSVRTLVDEDKAAGTYSVVWDGRDLHGNQAASGVYLYRMQAEDHVETKKMMLLK